VSTKKHLQDQVLKKLETAGIFCWRQNNNAVWDKSLNSGYGGYRAFAGMKGVPDIICIIDGQFVGVEIKVGKDKLSTDQVLFKRRTIRNSGQYLVVKQIEDIDPLLKP